MSFEHLIYLLPCHSLEDLGLERRQDEAEELLSAWCALYHPALVAAARSAPKWASVYDPPQDPTGRLVAIPPCCEGLLASEWLDRAEAAGTGLIRRVRRRSDLIAAAAQVLGVDAAAVNADLSADFLALGYGHFLIELLTRQLRYSSNLDEVGFQAAVVAAATAAVGGDEATARRELQQAYTLLSQAREYYYPVEAHLIDLTVVATTTLGESLRRELYGPRPCNLLISGDTLAELARCEPDTLAALKTAVGEGRAGIVGGEAGEPPLPLLSPEAIHAEIERGLTIYQRHLDRRPTVYGRRRYGLTPMLPQILNDLGFVGALHATLDDGRFPTGNQSRLQWEGLDGSVVECIGRVPIDVARPDVFLRLPERLGNSMDLDHVATVVFAHWPGQSSPWYDDLRRIASYTTAIGTFATVETYFSETGASGYRNQHKADDYHSPYLKQAVDAQQPNPISRWTEHYRLRAIAEATANFHAMQAAAQGQPRPANPSDQPPGDLLAAIDRLPDSEKGDGTSLDGSLKTAFARASEVTAEAINPGAGKFGKGTLILNPCGFAREDCVGVDSLGELPDVASPVLAAANTAAGKRAIVEVPAMGFAWIEAGSAATPPAPAAKRGWFFARKPAGPSTPPLADDNLLQNEHMQVVIDRHTGCIRAVLDGRSRGPRVAQQIALRSSDGDPHDPGHESHYSIMAADELRITSAGPLVGEIVARGRLMDRQGQRVAGFAQTTRLARHSRTIEIEIELAPDRQPGPNPWQSYYAARFAWDDESAGVYRNLNYACVHTEQTQFESPLAVEIRTAKLRTAILCGGLPYHRRVGRRRLDTLLVVRGETQRRFHLALGIDLPNTLAAGLDQLAPLEILTQRPRPPATHGWLFHLEARGVVATHWDAVVEDGHCVGVRVRLLETEGRRTRFGLRACRELKSARRVLPGDAPPSEFSVAGDRAEIEVGAYGWIEAELRFA